MVVLAGNSWGWPLVTYGLGRPVNGPPAEPLAPGVANGWNVPAVGNSAIGNRAQLGLTTPLSAVSLRPSAGWPERAGRHRRRGRTRPCPAGQDLDTAVVLPRSAGGAPQAAGRAGPGVPGLLRPQGITPAFQPCSCSRPGTAWHAGRYRGERITENTLVRLAIDLLIANAGQLHGSAEDELGGGHSVWGTEARAAVSRARSISRARAACAG